MRPHYITASLVLVVSLAACKKDQPEACGDNYRSATVIQGRNGCEQNGFLLQLAGGETLSPDDLPATFQQPGLKVCLSYTTYEDLRNCACCGGTRLRVVSIQRQ